MPEQLYCNGKVIFLYNALSPPAKQVVFCFGHLHFSEHEKLQYPQQDKSHKKTIECTLCEHSIVMNKSYSSLVVFANGASEL